MKVQKTKPEKNPAQIKSKERVAAHGEVFTAEREVNAMLDLVKQETERIDSRFLEPACGTGNFLVKILERKLDVVKKKYRRSPLDFERNSVLALSSIYGVDILADNISLKRIIIEEHHRVEADVQDTLNSTDKVGTVHFGT